MRDASIGPTPCQGVDGERAYWICRMDSADTRFRVSVVLGPGSVSSYCHVLGFGPPWTVTVDAGIRIKAASKSRAKTTSPDVTSCRPMYPR